MSVYGLFEAITGIVNGLRVDSHVIQWSV